MSDVNPEEILEYCNEATGAPWVGRLDGWTIRAYPNNEIAKHGFKVATTCSRIEGGQGQIPSVKEQVANQQFIAKARTDLPLLAEKVIALEKERYELKEQLAANQVRVGELEGLILGILVKADTCADDADALEKISDACNEALTQAVES